MQDSDHCSLPRTRRWSPDLAEWANSRLYKIAHPVIFWRCHARKQAGRREGSLALRLKIDLGRGVLGAAAMAVAARQCAILVRVRGTLRGRPPAPRFRTIANFGYFARAIKHMRFPSRTRESPHFRASTRLIVKHFFGHRAAGSAGWSCRPRWCSSAWGTPRSRSPWTYTAIYSRAAMTVPSWRRPRRLCSRSRAESSRSLSLIKSRLVTAT